MKNKYVKLFVVFLLSVLTILNVIPAYADEYVSDGKANTSVLLNIGDNNVLVGVPTNIIVSGTPNDSGKYIGNYSVSVEGDISGEKSLYVAPENDTVTLSQKGKNDVVALIHQDKSSFSADDLANNEVANGTVVAENLTAGNWNGQFSFNISYLENTINDEVLNGYTVLYKYDLSATSNDDVAAYYCVPNDNTSPIQVEDNNTQKAKSLLAPMSETENNFVEYNGIRYELSDDDTLVISGQGKMKSDVYKDLVNTKKIQDAVEEHFGNVLIADDMYTLTLFDAPYVVQVRNSRHKVAPENAEYIVRWDINKIYPRNVNNAVVSDKYESNENYSYWTYQDGMNNKSKLNEINSYIDEIKNDYIVSLPKTVIINEGVTNISQFAFKNCETLTSITIPSTVTEIGTSALSGTGLIELEIPDTVNKLGANIFLSCKNLVRVKLPNGITEIPDSTFQDCDALKSVAIPEGVKTMGLWVFMGDESLVSVTLPKSLVSMENHSFASCSAFKTIYYAGYAEDWEKVDKGEQEFNPAVFYDYFAHAKVNYNAGFCDNYYYYTPADYSHDDVYVYDYYNRNVESLNIPSTLNGFNVIRIGGFDNMPNLKSVTIPDSVIELDEKCFYLDRELTNVVMSKNVTSIPNYAFNSTKIGVLPLNEKIVSIGNSAFAGCTMLSQFNIPNSVKTIGNNAFTGCTGFTTISIPDTVESVGSSAFRECTGAKTIYIPKNATLGNYCFASLDGATVFVPKEQTDITTTIIGGASARQYPSNNCIVYVESQELYDIFCNYTGFTTVSNNNQLIFDASKF